MRILQPAFGVLLSLLSGWLLIVSFGLAAPLGEGLDAGSRGLWPTVVGIIVRLPEMFACIAGVIVGGSFCFDRPDAKLTFGKLMAMIGLFGTLLGLSLRTIARWP